MGKDLISDEEFFRFQKEQRGAAARAIEEYARRKPAKLRAQLKLAIEEAVNPSTNSVRVAELHHEIRNIRDELKELRNAANAD